MGAAADLVASIAAARAVTPRFASGSDDEVLADTAGVEELGRLVDAMRIDAAAQLERRSRKRLGEDSLAFRSGARDGDELVQQVCRIDSREAKRRVALGTALAPSVALNGDLLPGRHPVLADAVRSGAVGVEAARVVVNAAKAIGRRVAAEDLDVMVEALTDTATVSDVETLHDVAAAWALALDPDGADPDRPEQHLQRALRIGRTTADGMTRATVVLTPEHLAMLKELLQSRRRGLQLVRTEPASDDDPETTGAEWREEEGPGGGRPRSRAQQDYDTLLEALEAGVKADQADVASEVIHETVVTITAAELEARRGQAFPVGVLAGIPIPVVERRVCTGGIRLLVTDEGGEPLHLGRSRRLFSPAQRKALAVGAGGRCQHPGCRTPSPYLEAHHAAWFARDDGPTDVRNGIMLCSYHHHLVHAVRSPVRIVRHEGDLFVVPVHWTGPPAERHRRQRGVLHDARITRLRRWAVVRPTPWRATGT
ncbi:DUF222 domain-containing protein [Amnibacterium soli]|uniref:DUF222 domain-containing protein n=1 Tax=Amnibacterium soli TaxID=1282736 RepID=UPI0031E98131